MGSLSFRQSQQKGQTEGRFFRSLRPTSCLPPFCFRPPNLINQTYVGGSRWRIETEFETEKSDVGLDEYETRTWAGWHHHVALMPAGWSLSPESAAGLGGERCPGSPGPKSTGWFGKCCPGNGSGRMSCCAGWRRRKNATNEPDAPMPSAEPPFVHPRTSLLEPSLQY